MLRSLRNRLALLLVATVALTQGTIMVTVYAQSRSAIETDAQIRMGQSQALFERHLDELNERMVEAARLVSLDFALREAIATDERATIASALRNFGRRVRASRVQFIALDGAVRVDTATVQAGAAGSDPALPERFPFPALLRRADIEPAAGIAVFGGRAWRIVVAPVLAPEAIGWIALAVEVDSGLAEQLAQRVPIAASVALTIETEPGDWHTVGTSNGAFAPDETGRRAVGMPLRTVQNGATYLLLSIPIRTVEGSRPVTAVLEYGLDAALAPYRPWVFSLLAIQLAGLLAALIGAVLIARGVARPIEALATAARRIEAGDYIVPARPTSAGGDEVRRLSATFDAMARSIQEREARIRHQAEHDQLTGLPNRASLERLLEERIGSGMACGLVLVGFDRLQEIHATLGHALGDAVIVQSAERLRDAAGIDGTVARIADGIFAIPVFDRPGERLTATARRALAAFDAPVIEGDITVDCAAAVGMSLAPDDADSARQLLQHADIALYAAFQTPDRLVAYERSQDPHRPERLSLMGELKEAIERDQLSLVYQPKIALGSGKVLGAEALIRWNHPRHGPISPAEFIPMAEDTGTIRLVSRWVLATAFRQMGVWRAEGLDLKISLNLSVRDLVDRSLPDAVAALLAEHRVPADRVVLEITESAVMRDPDGALSVLQGLAALGVELSLDDFGVGHSSLTYLRRLPVHEIKIDQSFVRPLASSKDDRSIVRSIVDLSHALGHRVVAEGVEDQAALDLLTEYDCDSVQGYFLSRPLAVDAFAAFARAPREAVPA